MCISVLLFRTIICSDIQYRTRNTAQRPSQLQLFSLNAHMGSDILQDMSDEKLAAVCAPKAAGAAAFDAAHLPLVSKTLFSSTSAVWSQPAAGHYAAANAVADGIAAAQRAAGRPATAVQFGPFGGTGMAAAHTRELAAIGLTALQPAEVLYYSCGFAWFLDPGVLISEVLQASCQAFWHTLGYNNWN